MEEETEYEEGGIGMSASAPQYWSRLGSSKSRTNDQQEQGRELILDMMMEAPEGTTFAFTDGSCLTNPRPPSTSIFEETGQQKRFNSVGGAGCHSNYLGIHGSTHYIHEVQPPEDIQ